MFRMFWVLLLTIGFVSISNAGFDSVAGIQDIPHPVIIVLYRFESATQIEGSHITEDIGIREAHGFLWDDAAIVENGKYGNCLQLQNKGAIGTLILPIPALVKSEFSFTVWVKLQQQVSDLHFILAGRNAANETVSGIMVAMTSSDQVRGSYRNSIEDITTFVEADAPNVSDNQWHHIVFSKIITTYTLYVDGEPVASAFGEPTPKLIGERVVFYISNLSDNDLIGEVLIDDLGYFETGFSPYDVKGLYNDGLTKFLETMPVSPQGRLTTTWGHIKSQYP